MHELSIAQSIIEGAAAELERYPENRVAAVHLQVGVLSGVVKEALLFSYDLAAEGTPLQGSRLEIENIAAAVFCPICREERVLDSIQNFRCPVCLSPTPEVIRGRELLITALELENGYAAAAC
ncbi:MAG: hydrogenase maturation nickel metallochaperone HypA [Pyrinomonadaceae bacterium]